VARKETYRQRYTNKIIAAGESIPGKVERKERVPIDPAIQQSYLMEK